jgi:tetratricopeptide (TPR) repeat protein
LDPLSAKNPAVAQFQTERAAVHLNLFQLELSAGNTEPAKLALEQARDIYQTLVEQNSDELWFQRDLAVTLREQARLQYEAGDVADAKENLDKAVAILNRLVELRPMESEFRTVLEATKEMKLDP